MRAPGRPAIVGSPGREAHEPPSARLPADPRQETAMTALRPLAEQLSRYQGKFLTEDAPANEMPAGPMPAVEAMRLIEDELVLDGIPERNLATFVTTWMG